MRSLSLLAAGLFLLFSVPGEAAAQATPASPRFRIELPDTVLRGTPVSRIRIEALTPEGELDAEFDEQVQIEGIRIEERGEQVAAPSFEGGVLTLASDLRHQRIVEIVSNEIRISAGGETTVHTVRRIPGVLSLLPPVLAILLAIWLRDVLVALFAGIWAGAIILAGGDPFTGLMRTLDTYLLEQLQDSSHLMVLLFTLFLGATVAVMSHSGGTAALVDRLAHYTQTRERGQFLTFLLGMVVFFDDYANCLLVGTTMRPVTDRLRISREKLAFLVDSTAAPVAGLALISTWVGVEISYIETTYRELGIESDVYGTFLATIPYRFYPLLALVFVGMIASTGRDFGPMLRAEARALRQTPEHPLTLQAELPSVSGKLTSSAGPRLVRNAVVPLLVLVGLVIAGLWWTGTQSLAAKNAELVAAGQPVLPVTLWTIIGEADSNRVLLLSSFVASMVAVGMAVGTRALRLNECMTAWLEGGKHMFLAIMILVLAWGIGSLCDESHLNTAGYLTQLTQNVLSPLWMPTIGFLLSAAISFATGSSWATMGLLMPLFITLTWSLLQPLYPGDPNHPLMLATMGSILGGSIFGDHCSPISDTTVLSSASADCNHLDHVETQIPYALTVGGVSLLLGYLPLVLGASGLGGMFPLIALVLGSMTLFAVLRFCGRTASEVVIPAEATGSPAVNIQPRPAGDESA